MDKEDRQSVLVLIIGVIAVIGFFWGLYWLITWTEIKTCDIKREHNMVVNENCFSL